MGGMSFLPCFILIEVGFSYMMTWVYNKTKGSLLIGGIMAHAAINTLGALLITEVTAEAFTQGTVDFPDRRLILLFFGIMTFVALILVIVTTGRLGYSAEDEAGA